MTLILPKRWDTHDAALLANQLDRLVEELVRFEGRFAGGLEPRFILSKKVNGGTSGTVEANVPFGHVLPVFAQAGGTVIVRLPSVTTDRDAGRICAVSRRTAAGTVLIVAPGGSLINGVAAQDTLATTRGLYLFAWEGDGFWSRNSA